MKREKKECVAEIIRELYLHPYVSKEENIVCGCVWLASWIIGIMAQQNEEPQAIGGAFLIFSLSLMLEFVPMKKRYFIPNFVHGLFCIMLVLLLAGSIFLIFYKRTSLVIFGRSLNVKDSMYYMGWIVFFRILISMILSLFEIHRFLYDKEKVMEFENEEEKNKIAIIFMDKANGTKGGMNS